MGIRVSLRALRLIPRPLKLTPCKSPVTIILVTTWLEFKISDYYINNHMDQI